MITNEMEVTIMKDNKPMVEFIAFEPQDVITSSVPGTSGPTRPFPTSSTTTRPH